MMIAQEVWIRDLVELAAAQAAGRGEAMEAAMARLQEAGRLVEVEEALLQSYLFLGFPAAIEAFRRWRTYVPGPPAGTAADLEGWASRGESVCSVVYGEKYGQLRRNIARFHPDLDRWMVVEGYGKVLGRSGLPLEVRELLIVAVLVVQGAPARRQLRSHLQGALNAGAKPAQIEATIEWAGACAGRDAVALARKLWSALRPDSVGGRR
jgi:4-carboxymuconolactone decarboxylase